MIREQQEIASLIDEALQDRSKVRKIISLLYDTDMEVRFMAARALGEVAKVRPEFIKQIWGRILNASDDTMSCWGVSEGLGEIARNMPELRGKILTRLRKFMKDESTCQGFIWAVCRIGQVDRERIGDFIPDLLGFLDSGEVCMIGQAVWALGELGIVEAKERLAKFVGDQRETWIYEEDAVRVKSLGKIADEALNKLPVV